MFWLISALQTFSSCSLCQICAFRFFQILWSIDLDQLVNAVRDCKGNKDYRQLECFRNRSSMHKLSQWNVLVPFLSTSGNLTCKVITENDIPVIFALRWKWAWHNHSYSFEGASDGNRNNQTWKPSLISVKSHFLQGTLLVVILDGDWQDS